VDILAVKNGKQIAFEIETGKSDVLRNIKKCYKAGLDRIVIVATSAKTKNNLSKIVQADHKLKLLSAQEIIDGDSLYKPQL